MYYKDDFYKEFRTEKELCEYARNRFSILKKWRPNQLDDSAK